MARLGVALGVGLGLAAGCAANAVSEARWTFEASDHYEIGWTVLAGGQVVCVGPFVRPGEREIECRSARLK
jgi:uncharacterized membrane protein YhdT